MDGQDIFNIDIKIKDTFKREYDNLHIYRDKLANLTDLVKRGVVTSRRKTTISNNIKNLEKNIEDIESSNELNFYIAETAQLLENYKKILQTPIKASFTGKKLKNNKEKTKIISCFLNIAQKYIEIDTLPPKKNYKIICNNCTNKQHFDIIDKSVYICLDCGAQQEIFLHTSSYTDVSRINISAKYTYDRKVHFRDCINQYQGKQNSTIEQKVYDNLYEQFNKHYLLIGDESMSKQKRCEKITKEHIHIFLKELSLSKHYENINLIYYKMTGTQPDNLSHLEYKLLEDFDKLTNLYDKQFKNRPEFRRKNFINTQYVLYQFLLRYKHPCNKDDFTILKTVDRKSFHDDITKLCFEELGWNHTPLF